MCLFATFTIILAISHVAYSNLDVNVVHLEQLSSNFKRMFHNREHDNILTIVVNNQIYFAHKNILSISSSYLRSTILQSKEKDEVTLTQLKLAHNGSFLHVLEYMYTGKLVLNDQAIDQVFDLLSIAKKLELTSLKEDISSLLLKESLNLENTVFMYENAIRYDQMQIKEACEHLIDQHADILVASKSLIQLSSPFLQEIIDRNSFSLYEAKVFELVHEWHVFQNRTDDLDIELMKKIRFELIPQEELTILMSQSKVINERIVHQILKERTSNQSTKIPRRKFQKLASGSDDQSIKIWNVDSGECIRTLTDHSGDVCSLQVLANNKLASGSDDKTIKIWNMDSGECIRTLIGHKGWVVSLVSLANNKLASGSFDKTIKIWDVYSGECIRTLTGHSNTVWSLHALSNNKLASGSYDNSIKIWNVDSGTCLRTLTGHSDYVMCLLLKAVNILVSGSKDCSIKIWHTDSGECFRTLTGHTSYVMSLQLLADHKLVSGSWDKTIKIWDLENFKCIRTLTGHTSPVYSLLLLANNKLASSSNDSTIQIWNVNTGERIRTLNGHSSSVWSLQLLASNV